MGETIIVLDDEIDMLALLRTIISDRTGHRVITTNNPLELEELMETHRPALIISDLKMLGRDGLEVIEIAHRLDATVPVVIITAYGSLDSAEEAVRKGAYDYIAKPFRKEQVLIAIDRAIEWRRLTAENARLKREPSRAPRGQPSGLT